MNFLSSIGRVFLAFLASVVRLALFEAYSIITGLRPPCYSLQGE